MLEVSKVVFVAFTQQCIQSNVTHVGGVEGVKYFTEQKIKRLCQRCQRCTLYTVASHPCQEGRLFKKPSILGV